jgi:hypothetical protein
MIDNVSPQRSLGALLSVTDSKTGEVRGKVASLICYLLENKGVELVGTKELIDGLFKSKLEKLISDQNPSARYHARIIVELAIESRLVGSKSEMEQYLSAAVIDRCMRERAKDKVKSESSFSPKVTTMSPVSSGSARSPLYKSKRPGRLELSSTSDIDSGNGIFVEESVDTSQLISSGKLSPNPSARYSARDVSSQGIIAKRELESVAELQRLPEIIRALSTTNASERIESLNAVTDIIVSYATTLKSAGKFESCLDCVIEKLEDSSIKVINVALDEYDYSV